MQNETAHCKKALMARCSDDPYISARYYYSPSAGWGPRAALCQYDINPLRYTRAERYCDRLTRDVEFQLHHGSEEAASQRNVTDVKSAVCEGLRTYVERLEGPLNATLSSVCGSDAVEAMRDGYRAQHAAFCIS
ncbi:uncharacterized protein LOC129600352 [Paramacrobiotus metropolitanus]|uniref:uncharacterized protein LOC129600352 n=1 Tax=Paramacrobiotus metropolitanus TaxID=2943436 RepID=UPI002445651F|nr:uncharacterized protein LOC129600352 [Paramacrobiotus metropolitanus]